MNIFFHVNNVVFSSNRSILMGLTRGFINSRSSVIAVFNV